MLISKKSKISIVLPKSPTPCELFAAKELRKYLFKMLSLKAPIAKCDSCFDGEIILIGGPEHNSATKCYISEEEFDSSVPGPEGIMIKQFGNSALLIAGSSKNTGERERGTLYAVYEFLERFCGCSLSAYSNPSKNIGEYVPFSEQIKLENIEYVKARADSPYRCAIVQYSNSAGNPDKELNLPFFDWLCKNRYNRILVWASTYQFYKEHGLTKELKRRGMSLTVGHHEASRLFLPAYGNEYFPEHYYETHPEYFKLLEDGSRFKNIDPWGQWVYCSRNKELVEVFAENVIEWLKQNPSVDMIALWPNDGGSEQCFCEECRKYSKTENYAYFTNEVVKKVNKVFPNVKFDILIYYDLWECPKNTTVTDSVLIDESTWHISGLRSVGKPDGSCLNGTHYEENLLNWKKAGARVVYYDYYMGVYGGRQRVIPMADELQSIWKNFAEKGIDGSGTQIECYNLWNHLLNFYSFARTGYDHSLTLECNIKNLTRIFGDGGNIIAEIMRRSEECLDGQVKIHDCGHYLMANMDTDWLFKEFEKALALANDKLSRNNIRLLRMAYRYTYLETKERLSTRDEYYSVEEEYDDESGELAVMTEYDSFWRNNPGYGITIPLKSEKKNFKKNIWYMFE